MDLIGIAFLLLTAATPPQSAVSPDVELVVTGQRPDPREDIAEEPYETTPRVMLGSRIPRKPGGRRVFNTVATESGLAGLMPGVGTNFDATGGAAPTFRKRHVKSCKVKGEPVDEVTACALLDARKKMNAGDFAAATAILTPLLASTRGPESHHAAHLAYQLAERSGDEAGRERALERLLRSGRIADPDQAAARKTLVAMALRRGDEASAIARLGELVADSPDDARSQANLAALYAKRGLHDQARVHMAAAVSAAERSGVTPQPAWITYLRSEPQ